MGYARKDVEATKKYQKKFVRYQEVAEKYSLGLTEYYGAAEPPVRCGVSHLSGLTEPPVYSYSA